MEGLRKTLLDIIGDWDKYFPSKNSACRAKALALGLLVTIGRTVISRALLATGKENVDWSAAYRFFSRTFWSPCTLFRANLKASLPYLNERIIAIAWDDTLIKKTGKRILGTSWQRDSLSPPWRVNFSWGFRFLQASLLLPLYRELNGKPCRAIPVQFEKLPKHKKPRKNAPQEAHEKYEELCKQYNASTTFVKMLRYMRNELNALGLKSKTLLAVVDGSYLNRTTLNHGINGVSLVGRTRKNARFFFRVKPKKGKQFYSRESFTAEEFRRDKSKPYKETTIHYAGKYRKARYKEITEVYQKHSTKKKPLRLIVVAPTPYRRTKNSRREYRDPAYLLTDDFTLSAKILIQKYFDRWQIEVNFKEEKQQLSLGKQQNWSHKSVEKVPAFIVASYGALMLAGVLRFSEDRNHKDFQTLPKWRNKTAKRPSFADFQQVLRREISDSGGIKIGNMEISTSMSRFAEKACA
jgi:hypothetical protein